MPDPSGLPAPYLDPSQYPDYLAAQRKQQLAQMLMQNFQQSTQTPADWNSMKVVPRRGLLGNVSTLASALMAGKAEKQAQQAQQNYFQGLMGGGTSSPPAATPQAPPSSPGYPQGSPGIAAPSSPQASAVPQSAPQAPPRPNAMLLPGTDMATSQRMLTMMGPQEYAKVLAGQYAPTDLQKMLKASGASEAQQQAALQAAIAKQTTNVQDLRPGGTAFDLTTRQPIFSAPQNGQQVQWGPNGPTATVLPNAPQAEAAMTGAETAAKTANTPTIVPTKGGGSTYAYPSDVLGTAPALRTPGLQAPRVASPNAPQAPQSAPAPQGSPWATMPKLPVGQGMGAPDDFTKGRLQEAGKKDAELSSKYGAEADLADQKQQYNAQAIANLPASETGPLSSWLTENKAALMEAGVPEKLIPSSGTVTPTFELNKYLKNAALQGARQIYGSRMTQMEVKLQTDEMSPSSAMTRDAIASLIQQDNIRNAYSKQRATDYGQYIQKGGDPLRFESWYAKSFPLTGFAKANTPAGSPPGATPKPQDVAGIRQQFTPAQIQAELKRRGIVQ